MSGLDSIKRFLKADCFANVRLGNVEQCFVGNFLKDCKSKYFVEAGAVNGFHLSQSAILESVHGFDGLLIEGHPLLFKLLEEGERKARKANAVLGNGKMAIFEAKTSGLFGHSQIQKTIKNDDCTMVFTKTLEEVMQSANAPQNIGCLVLDVEEALPEVLEGVDFENRQFEFIALEIKEKRTEIVSLLKSKGYSLKQVLGQEDYVFAP